MFTPLLPSLTSPCSDELGVPLLSPSCAGRLVPRRQVVLAEPRDGGEPVVGAFVMPNAPIPAEAPLAQYAVRPAARPQTCCRHNRLQVSAGGAMRRC